MENLINKVNPKILYEHILKLEGPRHPIKNLDKLNNAADYIIAEFNKFGLSTNQQEFNIQGFDEAFRNIEGYIGNDLQPELLILSHYDTVANCPGANDNASGIALMLECARVLAQKKKEYNIRFISFSLEEGDPYIELKCKKKAKQLGITNKNNRYLSLKIHEFMSKYNDLFNSFRNEGQSYIKSHQEAIKKINLETPPKVQTYFKFCDDFFGDIDKKGKDYYTIGSEIWLKEALENKKEIKGILCFDTIAYTNQKRNSQWFPASMSPRILRSIFKTHKVDFDKMIGDFITIIASKGSDEIIEAFSQNASNEMIDLPYAYAHFNIGYQQIASIFPDLLRSDHGPFWKENIPGLFFTDTANFRFPFYHTQADTIEKLDFNFLAKITKATVATISDLNNK